MSQFKIKLTVGLFAMACLAVSGCGYRHGELFDGSYHTISVPIFQNRSFYRGTEFQLTEALTKEVEHRTPYKIAATSGADSTIVGTILAVDKKLISRAGRVDISDSGKTIRGRSSLPMEMQVIIVASFEWKDLRTGRIIRKLSRVEGTGEYVPTIGVGEPVEVALNDAINELAREIVSAMRKDW